MKESTHILMTLDFWRICISNFLLYAAVWTLLPVLPAQCYLMGMNTQEMAILFLLFVAGMIGVGPLHAFLGDVFKRKYLLLLFTLVAALCFSGWLMATEVWQVMLLMLIAGASFGIATTAGITIGIDITQSNRRGVGNRIYAFSGALGLLIGICCSSSVYLNLGFNNLVIISLLLFLLSFIMVTSIYVAFRAPVGVGLFNIDRFFLPLAWVPAINVCLLSFGIGMLLNLLPPYSWIGLLMVVGLTALSVPLTRLFVKLSHHCQRGTANTTLQLATQTGLDLGLIEGERIANNLLFGVITILLSVLMFVTVSWPYFKQKRVRP
ncbi:MAG: MFS transporter [Bacteroidaceae bacterium]|nr:MFS transporter [Bacteroidaceae bacterium]